MRPAPHGSIRFGAAVVCALALCGRARAGDDERAGPAGPPGRRIVLVAPTCPSVPLELAAFVELFRIEVRAGSEQTEVLLSAKASPDPGGDDTLTIDTVPCAPGTSAMVATYAGGGSRGRFERHVDLGDVRRDERPRVLALVLAELLRDRPEVAAAPPPVAPPPVAVVRHDVPSPEDRRAPEVPLPAHLWTARLAVDARAFRSLDVVLLGGSLGVGRGAAILPLQGVADVTIVHGLARQTIGSTGSVDVTAAVVAAGGDLTTQAGPFHLALGPRVEVGWGWLSGHPNDATVVGRRFNGPFGGASLAGSIAGQLTRTLRPFLELQSGVELGELVGLADGVQAARLGGWWAVARVGTRIGF